MVVLIEVDVVVVVVDGVEVVEFEIVEVVDLLKWLSSTARKLRSMKSRRVVCYSSRVRQVLRMISITKSMLPVLQSTSFKPSISASARQFSPGPSLG
jgi:hypothetical protein